MGGINSGRYWSGDAKPTVNHYHSIDIRTWQQKNLLVPGTTFTTQWVRDKKIIRLIKVQADEKFLTLNYQYHSQYTIEIEWTPCRFGGKRPWFCCPACNCGRRTAILYSGVIFACRVCHRLGYPSQLEDTGHRAARKAEKIRKRLHWEPGILNGEESKPKGMHRITFIRLYLIHNKLVTFALKEIATRLGINTIDL